LLETKESNGGEIVSVKDMRKDASRRRPKLVSGFLRGDDLHPAGGSQAGASYV
jgi:hypothetical protein